MKPTVIAPTPTCREFLGTTGWCPTVADDGEFCKRHAAARRRYDQETLNRTKGGAA